MQNKVTSTDTSFQPFIIGPAGGNISYIQGVLQGLDITPQGLSYHHLVALNGTSDFAYEPIDDRCIKIYFNRFFEFIVLNWHYKLRVFIDPSDRHHLRFGPEWEQQQKEAWKYYGDHWEIRAVLRWLYSIYTDPIYGKKIKSPGRNFNGCCLYEGFEESKQEFANFGVNYTQKQYHDWKDGQKQIISAWKNMDKPDFVNEFKYDFEKGVYVGLQGIRNKMTEQQAWESYIK